MDTSNTINFVLDGKVKCLSSAEWAQIIWSVVERNRSSFQHFLGFQPMREFHERKADGGIRTSLANAIQYPSSELFERHCREVAVLEASSSSCENVVVEHHKKSLLMTREGSFYLHVLKYRSSYSSIPEKSKEEVILCRVFYVDYEKFLEIFGEYGKKNLGVRVLGAVVALAGATYDRRKKMTEKDLETYEKMAAVYNRVCVLHPEI